MLFLMICYPVCKCIALVYIVVHILDGVILGVSSEEHLKANITAFEKGPLEPGM